MLESSGKKQNFSTSRSVQSYLCLLILGSFCNKFPAAELNGNSIVARFVTKRGLLGAHCCGGEKILIEEQDAPGMGALSLFTEFRGRIMGFVFSLSNEPSLCQGSLTNIG